MDNKNSFYITTPIYYVSGKPHLGHAYTSIACDVLTRFNRDIGKDVFFLTGTDEHGQKIAKKAEEKNMSPKEFVDSLIKDFKELIKELNISNDYFIRTTNEDHKKFIQEMLQKSFDAGDIYKDYYEGLYCIDCEQYYKEEELDENNICPIHKKKVNLLKEEAYFFKLSKFQNKLLELYKNNPEFLSPKSKAQEIINRVEDGLMDVCISRNKNNLTWGIELPFDKNHVAYVWFDALFNYVSALKINNNFEKYWPANVHVIGKDIMWFHTVYWPAFLMSVKLELPKKVFSHGWWTVNGEKMGKSMGNVIEPLKVAKEYGVDEFRFFMLANGSFGDDLDFSYEKFQNKINNELNNDLGNLVSRVHAMTSKYFNGITPKKYELKKEDLEYVEKLNIFEEFNKYMNSLQFNQALDLLFTTIRETNAYINRTAPYKEEDKERLSTIMNILISSTILFGKYINAFMPKKSELIFKQFNIKNDFEFKFKYIEEGIKLNEKENLFQKIKLESKDNDNKGNKNMNNNNKNNNNNNNKINESKIKAVIFDFDGVIIDNAKELFEVNKECNFNMDYDEWIEKAFSSNSIDFINKLFSKEDLEKIWKLWEEKFKTFKIEKHIKNELRKLSSNFKLFIISSNKEEILNDILERENIKSYFKEVLGSNQIKSKTEKINNILKKYNLKKDEIIFVTDTLGDLLEANASKVKTICVDFGYHKEELLKKGNPFKIVSSFKKIRKEIEKLNSNNENNNMNKDNNNNKNNMNNNLEISKKEGFSSLDLRVGKIIDIIEHPDSNKMFVETIDLGEEEPRTIVSGLKKYYSLEEMKNKKVIVLCNLKPAKLRGIKSSGMVLVSENEETDKLGLLLSNAEIGTHLEIENEIASNPSRIKVEKFFEMDFKSDGNDLFFEGKKVKVKNGEIIIDRNIKGNIC